MAAPAVAQDSVLAATRAILVANASVLQQVRCQNAAPYFKFSCFAVRRVYGDLFYMQRNMS